MPSLHKVLKLKAGVRATTAKARLFPAGVESENNNKTSRREKHQAASSSATDSSSSPLPSSPSSVASSRPSFVNSFVSSFSSSATSSASCHAGGGAAALDLRHGGKDSGLSASESLSRAISTPSVHRPLRQSSPNLILESNTAAPDWAKGLPVKVVFVNSLRGGRAEDVLQGKAGAAIKVGSNSHRGGRVSPRRHLKDTSGGGNNAVSSLRNEVWKEKRWRTLGAEVREEEASKRECLAEFDKNSVQSLPERIVQSEDATRSLGHCQVEEKPTYNGAARAMSQELSRTQESETNGKVNGWIFGKSEGGLKPMRNRLVPVNICSEGTITPRSGGFFTRALHHVSLAGDGTPSDPPSENASNTQSQQSENGKSLKLLSGACNLPHPDKVKTGGEDAYFICPEKQVVGVADGVGGWADLGIDAGEYARELMSQSLIAVQQEASGCIDPARVMEKAHSLTKCRGSSTACILALTDSVDFVGKKVRRGVKIYSQTDCLSKPILTGNEEAIKVARIEFFWQPVWSKDSRDLMWTELAIVKALEAANLGDSGFVIVRDSRTIFKSPVQQHQFNIPFQLEHGGSDPPSAAQVFSFNVSQGDIIVAGTDGLFDNLYDSELTTVVVQSVRGGLAPQVTAQKIAALARSRAQDKNRQTPFSTAAQDAGFRFYGGKMDDITVIVSYITSTKSATSRL